MEASKKDRKWVRMAVMHGVGAVVYIMHAIGTGWVRFSARFFGASSLRGTNSPWDICMSDIL